MKVCVQEKQDVKIYSLGRRDNGLEKKKQGQTDLWRETLCDGTSHTDESHYLLNFT